MASLDVLESYSAVRVTISTGGSDPPREPTADHPMFFRPTADLVNFLSTTCNLCRDTIWQRGEKRRDSVIKIFPERLA